MINILLCLTTLFLLILSYPVWLSFIRKKQTGTQNAQIKEVSAIFLSHNGGKKIEQKLFRIIEALKPFQNWELIVIDNNSQQETRSVLDNFRDQKNVRIIHQKKNMGVAQSMNLGVELAKYSILIFCDQRQKIISGNLNPLLAPLNRPEIGAVSATISPYDIQGNYSLFRAYENFIKVQESKTGSVMGVYGPLFSIKKELYPGLPNTIILDDLYLSLNILKTKMIVLSNETVIIDENFLSLYDEKRAKRYLNGLLQILKYPGLIGSLSPKNIVLLIWHKYTRLLIPILLFLISILSLVSGIKGSLEFFIPIVIFCFLFIFRKMRGNLVTLISVNWNYFKAYFQPKKRNKEWQQ